MEILGVPAFTFALIVAPPAVLAAIAVGAIALIYCNASKRCEG
jgi:hypothetical protein